MTSGLRAPALLVFVLVSGCGGAGSDDPDATAGAVDGGTSDAAERDGAAVDGGAVDGAVVDRDAAPGACSPRGLQDDFSAPDLDRTRWRTPGTTGISPEIVDGRLTFTPVPDVAGNRSSLLVPIDTFDLTGCTTWVEVPRVLPTGITGEVTWSIAVGDDIALIRVRRPDLHFAVTAAGVTDESSVPFDETAHRWWRFRDEGGVLHLETSPDGIDWTGQLEHAHTWDLGAVRTTFGVVVSPTDAPFAGPQLDNVDVAP